MKNSGTSSIETYYVSHRAPAILSQNKERNWKNICRIQRQTGNSRWRNQKKNYWMDSMDYSKNI